MYSHRENEGFHKIGTFFEVRTVGRSGERQDLDHVARWVPVSAAVELLEEEFQRWALKRASAI